MFFQKVTHFFSLSIILYIRVIGLLPSPLYGCWWTELAARQPNWGESIPRILTIRSKVAFAANIAATKLISAAAKTVAFRL